MLSIVATMRKLMHLMNAEICRHGRLYMTSGHHVVLNEKPCKKMIRKNKGNKAVQQLPRDLPKRYQCVTFFADILGHNQSMFIGPHKLSNVFDAVSNHRRFPHPTLGLYKNKA